MLCGVPINVILCTVNTALKIRLLNLCETSVPAELSIHLQAIMNHKKRRSQKIAFDEEKNMKIDDYFPQVRL